MQIALILLYPLVSHLSIIYDQQTLKVIAIQLLASGILYTGLARKNRGVWLLWLTIFFFSCGLAFNHNAIFILYWPPVILPLLPALVFIRSLLPGNEPLITAIGELHRGPLSPEMRHYSRKVTWIWALCLLSMSLWSIILPILGLLHLWSLFTNFLNYTLIAGLFLVEFYIRVKLFPEHDHPTFYDYIKIVLNTDIRKVS
jgi:uncharacterized membrane protein